jgi:hypothetical protein
MKKYLPYIIAFTVIALFVLILIIGRRSNDHIMDERITLNHRDQIPYGTAAAKALLPSVFPKAGIFYDSKSPGNWDSLLSTSYDQAVILIARNFNADDDELNRLTFFAQQGNYVFIIARSFSYNTIRFFNFSYKEYLFDDYKNDPSDSLSIKLNKTSFHTDQFFLYPGRKYESVFFSLDTLHTSILGENNKGRANFIGFKTGNGGIFIHAAPLAFSNYFILHKNNAEYFSRALSVIPDKVDKVLWNEYYLNKQDPSRGSDPSWLRVLFKYQAFKWGLITAFFVMVIYLLNGIRRQQRLIPVKTRLGNDSLDFIKTLGRLYHDRNDHLDLAKKMSVHFLEHVRTTYKIPSSVLDDSFVKTLHYKSGYSEDDLTKLITFINKLDELTILSPEQLSGFYNQLELFYQKT